jgi:hypothetical protein
MSSHHANCTFGWDGACVVACPHHPSYVKPAKRRRKPAVREIAGVENPFVRACKQLYYRAYKLVWPGTSGAPDRMVLKGIERAVVHFAIWGGYNLNLNREAAERDLRELLALIIEFVELKAPGKDAADHQARRHAELRALGFKVTVVDSPEAVKAWHDERA